MAAITRDRMVVLGTLTLVCAIAWAYLAYMGWGMAHMDIGATMAVMPQMGAWGPIDVVLVFAMWSIMMVAMMLPSAAPTILLFAALRRQLRNHAHLRTSLYSLPATSRHGPRSVCLRP
jgi:predicted metal-binding membrane protein